MTQTLIRPVGPLSPADDTTRDWRRPIRNVLVASIAVLVILSTIFEIARLGYGHNVVFGLTRLFCVGQEANVPTWFTSAMLLIASLLAATAALIRYQAKDSLAGQWGLLSALLCLMSLDETAVMHEVFSAWAAQSLFGVQGMPWFVYYAWIVPGAMVLGLIVWSGSTLWRSLHPQVRPRFTRAAALYFGGALGMEVAEAAWAAAIGLGNADTSPIYSALWTTQELLEMVGVAALILALLDYLVLNYASLTVELRSGEVATIIASPDSSRLSRGTERRSRARELEPARQRQLASPEGECVARDPVSNRVPSLLSSDVDS